MKKRRYILLALALLLPCLIAFSHKAENVVSCVTDDRMTVLCAGLDEAAGNTDVLMLITLDPQNSEITVLQIPRDTYFLADTTQAKINQIYPTYRLAGQSAEAAMSCLKSVLSEAMGCKIDYYVALNFSSIPYLVDRLGGLSVEIPADIPYGSASEIPSGNRILKGEEALAFIRYRAGYVEGDLARVDAQKLLLMSAYRKLKNETSLVDLLGLIPDVYKHIATDMTLSSQLSLAGMFVKDCSEYTVRILTLPGAATRSQETTGTWYYIPNKKASAAVLGRYFGANDFDPNGCMTDKGRAHFTSIYEKVDHFYRIYTEETIDELEIKSNN